MRPTNNIVQFMRPMIVNNFAIPDLDYHKLFL